MEETVMGAIHDMRNRLDIVKDLIHFHMMGEHQYVAEKELGAVKDDVNLIWCRCLQCCGNDQGQKEEK